MNSLYKQLGRLAVIASRIPGLLSMIDHKAAHFILELISKTIIYFVYRYSAMLVHLFVLNVMLLALCAGDNPLCGQHLRVVAMDV